jgi:hypothetical protein
MLQRRNGGSGEWPKWRLAAPLRDVIGGGRLRRVHDGLVALQPAPDDGRDVVAGESRVGQMVVAQAREFLVGPLRGERLADPP